MWAVLFGVAVAASGNTEHPEETDETEELELMDVVEQAEWTEEMEDDSGNASVRCDETLETDPVEL